MAATYSGVGVANDIDTITKMISTKMDQIIKKESVTAGLTASNEIIAAFNGGKTAKIPTLTTSGLGDYDTTKGYPEGTATVKWGTYELAYDRALKIDIDRLESIQTDGVATTANVAAVLTRQQIIPEIDAARISGLVSKTKAADATHVVEDATAPTKANILTKIYAGLDVIYEERGTDSGATIFVSNSMKSVLRDSSEYQKVRQVAGVPDLDLTTESIDGNQIVYVPDARMKTAYTFGTPGSSSTDKGGFTPTSTAQPIHFAIVAPGCAQGVVVFGDSKFISKEVNQTKDADSVMYRIYHDVIVEANSGASGIYAVTGKTSS